MFDNLVFVVTQKLAVLFIAGLTAIGGVLAMAPAANFAPSSSQATQTAIITNNDLGGIVGIASTTTTSTVAAIEIPAIPPSLLPTTTIPFCTATSTCGEKGLHVLVRSSELAAKANAAPGVFIQALIATPPLSQPTEPTQSSPPITAQSFLSDTTSSLKVLLNGLDELVLTTNLANAGIQNASQDSLVWGMVSTTIGGTGSVPAFSVAISCDPAPIPPDPTALDQNPTFNVRTAYACTVSLTPQSLTIGVCRQKIFHSRRRLAISSSCRIQSWIRSSSTIRTTAELFLRTRIRIQ